MLLASDPVRSISKGEIRVRRTDAIVMAAEPGESLSGQRFCRLLTFLYKESSSEASESVSVIAP